MPRGRTIRYDYAWKSRNGISYKIIIEDLDRIKGRVH